MQTESGTLLRSVNQVQCGDVITARLHEGSVRARVLDAYTPDGEKPA